MLKIIFISLCFSFFYEQTVYMICLSLSQKSNHPKNHSSRLLLINRLIGLWLLAIFVWLIPFSCNYEIFVILLFTEKVIRIYFQQRCQSWMQSMRSIFPPCWKTALISWLFSDISCRYHFSIDQIRMKWEFLWFRITYQIPDHVVVS